MREKQYNKHKVLLVTAFIVAVFFFFGSWGQAADKPIELRLAHMFPVGSPSHQVTDTWAKKIAEDSNGRLTIRIFPVGTLVPPPELYDGAAMGTTDISFGFRYLPKGYTLGVAFPFIIGAPDVVVGTKVYDDIWKKFPKVMNEEWKQVKVLWLTSSMVQSISTRNPVRRLEDMKGLQLRVPSKEMGALMKDLGATPAYMSTSDWVMAMEKRTVDGGTTQPGAVHDNKLAGRVNYVLDFSLGTPTPVFAVMNKDAYNDLPDDLKGVIDKNMDYGRKLTIDIWIKAYDNAKKYFKEEGVELIKMSADEEDRWIPIVEKARARVGADLDKKGLPGTKIVNYIKERIDFYTK